MAQTKGFWKGLNSVFTSQGDIARGDANADAERLAIGSDSQVMSVVGGLPTWVTLVPTGTIVPWIGGYFGNGSNGTFTNVLANTVANVNTLLNSTGWYVCDGAALNDSSSAIFNGANRYLPNLTDERFLQGNTTAGGIGGSNTMLDHTHTHSLTVAAHTHTFSGTSSAVSADHAHHVSGGVIGDGEHQHGITADIGAGGTGHMAPSSDNRAPDKMTKFAGFHGHGFSAWTGGINANHTHTYSGTTSGASASSISGSVGAGSVATSTNNRPKYLNVFFIMKVK